MNTSRGRYYTFVSFFDVCCAPDGVEDAFVREFVKNSIAPEHYKVMVVRLDSELGDFGFCNDDAFFAPIFVELSFYVAKGPRDR